jgi:S-adenosylmethionine synthetase
MTMESVAGKNPVTHVGKLYNALAGLVAQDLVDGIPGVAEATCHLVSQIGRSIADPQLADVRLRCDDLDDAARARTTRRALASRRSCTSASARSRRSGRTSRPAPSLSTAGRLPLRT